MKIAREEVERGRANIGFLEKLMIEKDNTLHHVIRKLKNTEAEKTEIVNELAKAKQDKEDIQNKM